jgi:hypothetical protein
VMKIFFYKYFRKVAGSVGGGQNKFGSMCRQANMVAKEQVGV